MEEEKKIEKPKRSTKSKVITIMLCISFFCVFSILLFVIFGRDCLPFTKCEVESTPKQEEKKEEKIEEVMLVENTDYFIKGEFKGQYLDITKRGYYIDSLNEVNAPYYYIICMGEKPTGGYSLEISEVKKINGKVEIIVKEISPSADATVTQALTYPTIIVEFPKQQENIVIKSTDGVEFPLLKDY